ncbi:MAG: monovalent cation/hydrogen antiporter [Solirubrobacteraceae bacterium]|nr:monovalent cation/hydrogen antiporter [Solirubrobacteraceae bacterium]
MGNLQIVIAALFVSAAGINALANWLNVPYPIPLVLGGLLLGLIPGIPSIQLNPSLVLLVFLPPLLYSSAFFSDLHAMRADARLISSSAIGLVLATAAVVAVIGHELIGLPWAVSFALGAIVSPTDPAAATAIMRRVGAPRRIVNILEGESLFNDATALVAFKIAVAAAVGASVSAGTTIFEFFGDAAGGIAIGLAVGWVIAEVRRRVTDLNTELTISLFTAYGAFVPADQVGASGVLAVVACGVYLGFRAPAIASPEARIQANGLWSVLTFLLNAALFILVGLQLRVIVDGLAGRPAAETIGYAAAVCAAVIAVRFGWGFLVTAIIRRLDRRPSQLARRADWRARVVTGWSGMRGAISLAAALSLPLHTSAGKPLPGRALIQFTTFALILVTLVGEGLTLPWLIRRLGVVEDGTEEENEEVRARLAIARAALDRVAELEGEDWTRDESVERVRRQYEYRQRRFKVRAGKIEDEDGIEENSLRYQRMMHEIYAAQRRALVELRDGGEVSSEAMRRVERELDLEESRLEV